MKTMERELRDEMRKKIRATLGTLNLSTEQKISRLLGLLELMFASGQETNAADAHRYPERHELRR